MDKKTTKELKSDKEKFHIPSEEELKKRELVSVLAELILNYSLSEKK